MNAGAATEKQERGLRSQTQIYTGPVVNPGPYAAAALQALARARIWILMLACYPIHTRFIDLVWGDT